MLKHTVIFQNNTELKLASAGKQTVHEHKAVKPRTTAFQYLWPLNQVVSWLILVLFFQKIG